MHLCTNLTQRYYAALSNTAIPCSKLVLKYCFLKTESFTRSAGPAAWGLKGLKRQPIRHKIKTTISIRTHIHWSLFTSSMWNHFRVINHSKIISFILKNTLEVCHQTLFVCANQSLPAEVLHYKHCLFRLCWCSTWPNFRRVTEIDKLPRSQPSRKVSW